MTGLAIAVLTFAMAGCGGESEPFEWPDDPTPDDALAERQSSPPVDPAEAAAIDEISTVVNSLHELEVEAHADPSPPHVARPEFSAYLADPLLSETLLKLNDMHKAGIVFEGRPTWEPTVAELQLEASPPTATVRDCVDATDWRSVFRESGDPVPGDVQPDQYVSLLQVKLYPDGWLVHDADIEEGEQC